MSIFWTVFLAMFTSLCAFRLFDWFLTAIISYLRERYQVYKVVRTMQEASKSNSSNE